jgi:uroporphyrinogen-III synthase
METGTEGLVLVTRTAAFVAATLEAIAARGRTGLAAPLLQVVTRPITVLPPVQAVLVTSANALPALPQAARRLPVLAVGDATAGRAAACGFGHVLSAGGDAGALAALVFARLRPSDGPLLLACGQGQGQELVAVLRARGYGVFRRIAYASQPVPVFPEAADTALQGGRVAAILFLSAAAAEAFTRLLPPGRELGAVDALAISPAVAARLRPLPFRRLLVSGAPTLDQVLALL